MPRIEIASQPLWQPLASGCEGFVEVCLQGEMPLRRKVFASRQDLRRYVLTNLLLVWQKPRSGYADLLRIPSILDFDLDGRVAISEFVLSSAASPTDPARRSAFNAAVVIAGQIDALDEQQVSEIAQAADDHRVVALLPRPEARGLDLNDGNWIFDGNVWALVDY